MEKYIDVSAWEGNYRTNPISWGLVPEDIVGVWMKATDGLSDEDDAFAFNWERCRQCCPAKRGAFHFWQPGDGKKQARFFLRTLGKDMGEQKHALDFEPNLQTYPSKIPYAMDSVVGFIETYKSEMGEKPIIYTGRSYWNLHMGLVAYDWMADLELWLAAYPYFKGGDQWEPKNYGYDVDKLILPGGWTKEQLWYWQFSAKGVVPGIKSFGVDLDRRVHS